MRIPSPYRKTPRRRRSKYAEDNVRTQEDPIPFVQLLKSPRVLIVFVFMLFLFGGMLLTKSKRIITLTPIDRMNIACRDLVYMGIALTNFNQDIGRYPSTEERLDALVINPGFTNWDGPYLRFVVSNTNTWWIDPWKRRYQYECADGTGTVKLYSKGEDGTAGTDDDRFCPYFVETEADRIEAALERWKSENEPGSNEQADLELDLKVLK